MTGGGTARIDKPITISGHAEQQMGFRGVSPAEVIEAIRTAPWSPAERGRLECRKAFPFDAEWNSARYATKHLRAIFVDEPGEIVVVTVYA